MATYKHIASLIIKYRNNELTDEERKELEEWCALSAKNQLLFDRLNDESYMSIKRKRLNSIDMDAQWEKITARLPVKKQPPWQVLAAHWKIAAAAVLLAGAVTTWFWLNRPKNSPKPSIVQQSIPDREEKKKEAAFRNRVSLTLSDGRLVYLDGKEDGQIAKQPHTVIYKKGDCLSYECQTGTTASAIAYNTVSTPWGSTYSIKLPDGSKAWVNAGSSITYPTAFTGAERRVKMTGEVYFEITHRQIATAKESSLMKDVPFVVDIPPGRAGAAGAQVLVLGTHFNINAYSDEPVVATTLLEGRVKISSNVHGHPGSFQESVLKPGEQAKMKSTGTLSVLKPANAGEVVAWTKQQFIYHEQDIKLIMREIARWYDLEVVYKNEVNGHYTFNMSRKATVQEILRVLETLGGTHFTMEGKKIIVTSFQG